MKKLLIISLLIISGPFNYAWAENTFSLAPENDLYIDVNAKSSNITKAQFKRILNKIKDIYSPILAKHGAKLVIKKKWYHGKVNAYATRRGKRWIIAMYGGLARHSYTTPDSFALVACHELGHHLGQGPKKSGHMWASSEGQSDYYSTLKCIRKYFAGDDNLKIVAQMEVNPLIAQKCSDHFQHIEDIAICKRSAMAGWALARVLKDMKKYEKPIAFETPDPLVVKTTNHAGYPSIQCRLDTYLAGGLCHVHHDVELSPTDLFEGVCARINGDDAGARPLCWFFPG